MDKLFKIRVRPCRVPTSLEMSGRFPVFRKSLEMSGNVWKCLYFTMLEIFVSGNVWILTPVPLPNFYGGPGIYFLYYCQELIQRPSEIFVC